MGTDEGVKMLVKTLFYYIAIVLEAFIFCFAGEYLSNKVSIRNHLSIFLFFCAKYDNANVKMKHYIIYVKNDVSFLHIHLSVIHILEQNDR